MPKIKLPLIPSYPGAILSFTDVSGFPAARHVHNAAKWAGDRGEYRIAQQLEGLACALAELEADDHLNSELANVPMIGQTRTERPRTDLAAVPDMQTRPQCSPECEAGVSHARPGHLDDCPVNVAEQITPSGPQLTGAIGFDDAMAAGCLCTWTHGSSDGRITRVGNEPSCPIHPCPHANIERELVTRDPMLHGGSYEVREPVGPFKCTDCGAIIDL